MESQYITKVEGHGTLHLDFDQNDARLHIEEGERLFEGLVLGKNYNLGPWICSRICGVCPTIHNLIAIKAIEGAFDIVPSYEVKQLRRLMLCAQNIQSHLLHLFFLALPDYMGLNSGLSIAKTYPNQFRLALELKRISDQILQAVGGRPVHPINSQVGGFNILPKRENLSKILNRLAEVTDEAIDIIKIFDQVDYPELEIPMEYLHLERSGEYSYYEGLICDSQENTFSARDYTKNIVEEVKSYSTAKFSNYRNKPFLVGALARINIRNRFLRTRAKYELEHLNHSFPSFNPFLNNLAQAVEILHFIEEADTLVSELLTYDLEKAEIKDTVEVKAGEGWAVGEAPRGLLYYYFKINEQGNITDCDIITPTAQNLTGLELACKQLMKNTEGSPKKERKHLIEMLIRAYDPCITCSVH